MAALPYMQFYVPDYLADTIHLTTEEHGAYLLLIFNYWQTGKAIPKNRLARVAGLSPKKWEEVAPIISEFFEEQGEKWFHARIEADLQSVRESQEKKIKAGQASAASRQKAAREQMKEQKRNGCSAVDEQALNECATNQNHQSSTESSTDNSDAPAKPKPSSRKTTFPDGFEVTDQMRTWFDSKEFIVSLDFATEQWENSMRARGDKYVDWTAAWRKAMGMADKWERERRAKIKPVPSRPKLFPGITDPRRTGTDQ